MMQFVEGRWEFSPPSLCEIGGGSQQSSSQGSGASSGQSLTLPSNFQNPNFTATAPYTSDQLQNLTSSPEASLNGVNPFFVNGSPSSASTNPLVAQITAPQQQSLNGIGNFANNLPNSLAGAFSTLQGEANPGFASSLATSPQTQAAISSAIAPIRNQFNTQTVPGLEGSFTQAGQRVGSSTGQGSSAFAGAFGNAQASELATEAATAGGIANNAYQTGLNITANAPGQIGSLSTGELNNMVTALNAQALPQLTQQYGISAGTSLYNQQMSTILQALGLQVQGEQPTLGYNGESTNSSTEQSSSEGSGQSFNTSFNPFNLGV